MQRRKTVVGILVLVAIFAAWYAFRPERALIDKTVNETFDAGSVALATGNFHSNAHDTRGIATIHKLADGRRALRLTQFETSNGPDVRVYLVAASDVTDDETVNKAGYIELGPMKGNKGDQNYDVPEGVNLEKYRTVTIWCERFSVNFGSAPLRQKQS